MDYLKIKKLSVSNSEHLSEMMTNQTRDLK